MVCAADISATGAGALAQPASTPAASAATAILSLMNPPFPGNTDRYASAAPQEGARFAELARGPGSRREGSRAEVGAAQPEQDAEPEEADERGDAQQGARMAQMHEEDGDE